MRVDSALALAVVVDPVRRGVTYCVGLLSKTLEELAIPRGAGVCP